MSVHARRATKAFGRETKNALLSNLAAGNKRRKPKSFSKAYSKAKEANPVPKIKQQAYEMNSK